MDNVSRSTVNGIINSFYDYYKPNYNYLPKHFCFDEFKLVKSTAGAMSFIFSDFVTGQIIDIEKDRRLPVLKDYFLQYSKWAGNKVKTIVIDIDGPYISLILRI